MNIDNKIWHSETNYYCEENNFNENAETELLPGTDIIVYNEESQTVTSMWFVNDNKQFIKYINNSGQLADKYWIKKNETNTNTKYGNAVYFFVYLSEHFKKMTEKQKAYYNKLKIDLTYSVDVTPKSLQSRSHVYEWDSYKNGGIKEAPVPLNTWFNYTADFNLNYSIGSINLAWQVWGASYYLKGTYTFNYKNTNVYLYHE